MICLNNRLKVYDERGGEKNITVQTPELFSFLIESASSSVAASFSYANSSAILADTEPSAMSTQTRPCQGKKKPMTLCTRFARTGTFAEAARRGREGSAGGWNGSREGRKCRDACTG